jgi:L-alanine-DL-glutamate epimerase-like enolase superfamily enzyme
MGLTFIKFDITANVFGDEFIGQATKWELPTSRRFAAPGTGPVTRLSDQGINKIVDIVAAVREAVGWDVALCIDHFGHGRLTANEVIRLAEKLEPFGLAWLEDPMGHDDIVGHKIVTDNVRVPICAGENLYLWDGFREMIETRAVDIIHPDLLTSGGMLETKRISDYAERYHISTALHFAGSPIAFMANVHCAASVSSFVALENHALDLPFWPGLVTGMDDPFMVEGYTAVPNKPGLGVDLNYEAIEENLRRPGLFEPTEYWNTPKLGGWRPKPDERWE